ncbi:MAG: tRNA 2-selenouridine(34) synthase MnmH [Helicobacteraceae bacterium]|jgi:tRNA 2-selenouridine synthase|nr:tRNA 2-selenouridine(34) synthase MnmH [Helicobacteraceae bacterium]
MNNLFEISAAEFVAKIREFDVILDARSPAEFEKAAIPRAENFFALDDFERAEVGALYKRSPFEARILGAAKICENLAQNLEKFYEIHTPADKIAIYCARGGLRSASVSVVLANIGYRIWRVAGGFKSYRAEVLRYFAEMPPYKFVVLDGLTGSGKSDLIATLDWSVDLENLARHKGSSFGAILGAQPAAMKFENDLHFALARFAPNSTIAIEAESKAIGKVVMPSQLYAAMGAGLRVFVESEIEDRVARITLNYGAISEEFFNAAMRKIAPYISRKIADAVRAAFDRRDLNECAFLLLTEYYDRVYKQNPRRDYTLKFRDLPSATRELNSLRARL